MTTGNHVPALTTPNRVWPPSSIPLFGKAQTPHSRLTPPGGEAYLCVPCYGLWLAHMTSQATRRRWKFEMESETPFTKPMVVSKATDRLRRLLYERTLLVLTIMFCTGW